MRPPCALVVAATLFACGERDRPAASHPRSLGPRIAAEVGSRLGVAVVARCRGILGMPVACDVVLPDGGALGLHLSYAAGTWDWSLDGLVITTDAIVEYLGVELGQLAVTPGPIACGPRIRRVMPAERIECAVAGGGKAFVSLDGDGGIAGLEVVLDPLAAAARSELVSAERADNLARLSRELARSEDDGDDDDDDVGDRDDDDEGDSAPPSDAPRGRDGVE